ncbi:MAG: diguanylate cyclase [Lachnospiraceae bacterium]|nr:diguanylate cyclase [Lachnospiraceae bacterium]MBR6485968.1 diguanylate cyclase [Lachnospiraceae bacterium]
MGYWIVVVDDDPQSIENAKSILSEYDMRVTCLGSGRNLLNFMKKHEPDLILLDILMPQMDGFETYRALRLFEESAGRANTPVIFLTGENNSETERRGLKAGASDYICKPFDRDILLKRINNTITNSKIIERLTEEATIDRLTGFLNKSSGTDRIAAMCRNSTGALMVLDLDNFKLVNDLFGHDMGDRMLVAFAGIIKHNIRETDVVCRIGGDEFMGFFANVTGQDAVASLVSRLNEQLAGEAEALMGKDHGIPLGISAGVAFAPTHSIDYQILFRYADSVLYKVKKNGKHGYDIYDDTGVEIPGSDDPDHEFSRVVKIVTERGERTGAMLLGQEAFCLNYRYLVRFMERYGGLLNQIMFSLSSNEKGVIFSEMAAEFGGVLKDHLRKSDLVFQCGSGRYFAVLPNLKEQDTDSVIERIRDEWNNTEYSDRVSIDHMTSTISF